MSDFLQEITTTVVACTTVCLHNGVCNADGSCACLPGYYGENCQNIGYNGYSTIGAIAGAVICIVFLLLLTCMAFAAHIRGPQGTNGESRLTRLVSVEARGNSFDESSVLARNDFPPEYADVVSTGRGRRFSSFKLGSRTNSIDEGEPRSPPPMYEIVIFGKKRRFSFRRGSKSQKSSDFPEQNMDTKDCIIEEVNEKYGDDVFVNETGGRTEPASTESQNRPNLNSPPTAVETSSPVESGSTAEPSSPVESGSTAEPSSPVESGSTENIQQSVTYEHEVNTKLENTIENVADIANVTHEQRHRQKHEDSVKQDERLGIETS
ncbi:uncharacterized protein [Antedon mediterranea]|uniref:uncharacterized protein n=1 Tax=Antedon mediterranea TaxID=105859 RepID=UPI003AF5A04C